MSFPSFEGYIFIPGRDCYGMDIGGVGHIDIRTIKETAEQDERCVAFNTGGWIKSEICDPVNFINYGYPDKEGIYIKKEVFIYNPDPKIQNYVISDLNDGLGNRLFIIATILAISKIQSKIPLICPELIYPSSHSPVENHVYFYRNITQKNIKSIDFCTNIVEDNKKFATYVEIPHVKGNIKLRGYFQSEKYFRHIKSEIMEQFSCPKNIEDILRSTYNLERSAFLHIRRGDYVNNSYHYIDLNDYYIRAIKLYPKDINWFILSNDILYCKQLDFLQFENVTFVDRGEIESLWLMSLCNGGICANSSFSWWGSYLQKNILFPRVLPNKIVNDLNCNITDYFPENYVILNVNDI